eukprot:TRINITY_DN2984_c0_g3_i1.p1 TRINITY_DN2984_c0_g3~~TRINITY_DN2984_c0_g3_i1.p1  ORF type:complete len:415 (+),score=146.40 TRINITY_DN2984_c0_g3_i1:1586-2830(+)
MKYFLFLSTLLAACQGQTSPEQIHLALTGVPGQMVVSWATQQDPNGTATVQYGQSSSALSESMTGESFPFVDGGSENRTIYIFNVKLVGLAAATRYFYRVGDGAKTWSDVYNFTTLPSGQPTVEMAVFGDMGVENAQSMPLLLKEAAAGAYDVILHVGDMAYDMDDDNGRLGDAFMNMIQPLAAHLPYQACLGNHEVAYNFSHWTNRFSGLNAAGIESGSNTNWWFSYDISYVHFVAISSEVYYRNDLTEQLAAQYSWLDQDLAKANANRGSVPWIVVYGHRPMYCSNVDDMPDCSTDAQQIRRGVNGSYSLEDMLAKYSVDIYFTAHEHSYERTWPVYRGVPDLSQLNHTYTDAVWTTNIVTGAGGCVEVPDRPAAVSGCLASTSLAHTQLNCEQALAAAAEAAACALQACLS